MLALDSALSWFFWLVVVIITSGLKMETACFSKKLTSTNQSTQHQNQKNTVIIVTAMKTSNLDTNMRFYCNSVPVEWIFVFPVLIKQQDYTPCLTT
jgi:hypothetical protein